MQTNPGLRATRPGTPAASSPTGRCASQRPCSGHLNVVPVHGMGVPHCRTNMLPAAHCTCIGNGLMQYPLALHGTDEGALEQCCVTLPAKHAYHAVLLVLSAMARRDPSQCTAQSPHALCLNPTRSRARSARQLVGTGNLLHLPGSEPQAGETNDTS